LTGKLPAMTNPEIDPRSRYRAALDWVTGLTAAVRPDQLTLPTPCPEYDVRTLLGHLICTVRRARAMADGTSVFAIPTIVTDVADDALATTYAGDAKRALDAWADDARLDAIVTAPWGQVPGRGAVGAYTNETLVHGWDLAVATGQDSEADPELAAAILAVAQRAIPADPRGGEVPFAPPVEPAADAGPTERLANWSGHHR
jgi:uncharacterized protein (TIGR03086 family)